MSVNDISDLYQVGDQAMAARQAGPVAKVILNNVGSLDPRSVYDHEILFGVGAKVFADEFFLALTPENFPQNFAQILMVLTDDDEIENADLSNFGDFANANGQSNHLFVQDTGQGSLKTGPYRIKRRIKKVGFRFAALLFNSGEDSQDYPIGFQFNLTDRNSRDLNGDLL